MTAAASPPLTLSRLSKLRDGNRAFTYRLPPLGAFRSGLKVMAVGICLVSDLKGHRGVIARAELAGQHQPP
jgi:hypothetical protein